MSDSVEFLRTAHDNYVNANHDALLWQLDRVHDVQPWINTKCNSITLRDYDESDGLRGPQYTYGWIQGRGLEVMTMHAAYFETIDTELSQGLDDVARRLYTQLNKLCSSKGGAFFCYDENFQPVCTEDPPGSTHQQRDPNIWTYSDLFVTKGLIAAAASFSPDDLPVHLAALGRISEAIKNERILLTESGHITDSALSKQAPDYGPMMIAMGAESPLHRLNLADHDSFSELFSISILEQYLDQRTGLPANIPGGSVCNIGHGIEFAGFVLAINRITRSSDHIDRLVDMIITAVRAGFNGTGINLSIVLPSLQPVKSVCPWWSLPETIQAVSLAYETTGNPYLLAMWKETHAVFFERYWRDDPPIAYQSMTSEGAVDYVPATPDLDPGYHTGLSLLTAIDMLERQIHTPTSN